MLHNCPRALPSHRCALACACSVWPFVSIGPAVLDSGEVRCCVSYRGSPSGLWQRWRAEHRVMHVLRVCAGVGAVSGVGRRARPRLRCRALAAGELAACRRLAGRRPPCESRGGGGAAAQRGGGGRPRRRGRGPTAACGAPCCAITPSGKLGGRRVAKHCPPALVLDEIRSSLNGVPRRISLYRTSNRPRPRISWISGMPDVRRLRKARSCQDIEHVSGQQPSLPALLNVWYGWCAVALVGSLRSNALGVPEWPSALGVAVRPAQSGKMS